MRTADRVGRPRIEARLPAPPERPPYRDTSLACASRTRGSWRSATDRPRNGSRRSAYEPSSRFVRRWTEVSILSSGLHDHLHQLLGLEGLAHAGEGAMGGDLM